MRAIHWVRSKQEIYELTYLLSFAAYNPQDRSLTNRLYLVYLFIFFSIWTFIVLVFFASGGAFLLQLLNPIDPTSAAIFVEILVLMVWSLVTYWLALKRSPVVFSEEDAFLICQMPLNPRLIILRWLPMPWLNSAIPFWFLAVTLGFSLAEITLAPGAMTTNRFLTYGWSGLQAWLVMMPLHLMFYVLIWAVGIWMMKKKRQWLWLSLALLAALIFIMLSLLAIGFSFSMTLPTLVHTVIQTLIYPLRAGFIQGLLKLALASAWAASGVSFLILFLAGAGFSTNRAAQETHELHTLKMLLRYGKTFVARELRIKKRLGVTRRSVWLPDWAGASALIWKDVVLQTLRTFGWGEFFNLAFIFIAMTSIAYLPNLGNRILLIAVWSIQTGKATVVRLRNDLAHWSVMRQLPLAHQKLILFDLTAACIFVLVVSLTSFGVAAVATATPFLSIALFLPGMIAAVAGGTAFDVIRRSRSSMLLSGNSPEVGALGIILGVLCAEIPVLLHSMVPGLPGIGLAFLSSVLLGVGTLMLAISTYRYIDISA